MCGKQLTVFANVQVVTQDLINEGDTLGARYVKF